MRLPSLILRALVGVTATGAVVTTATVPRAAQAAKSDDAIPGEAAVFARFSDLDKAETEERRVEFLKDEAFKESFLKLSEQLASGASAKEVEGTLLPLIAKRETADVDVSLAAVMLDYYYAFLQAGLADGSLTPADVFDEMIERDAVITTAAYGSTYTRRHIRR